MPNDPLFAEQYALHNIGQKDGKPDADVDAPEAWLEKGTGSAGIVVAVTDTGVDRKHADLAANMWINTREIPGNGRDDDRNGYVDDRYGYDFYNYDDTVFDPHDGDQHGTHVAGIIGAVGDNGTGVSGVNWDVAIMPVKFLGPWGGGDFEAAESIIYAVDNGADVINASWGGPYSEVLEEAVQYAADHGVLIVAAAGNDGIDQDSGENEDWRSYPASYEATNVIAVAATDRNDELTYWSNYGSKTVDLAAPGDEVLSTLPIEDTAFYIEKMPYRIVYNPFVLEALEPADQRDEMIVRSVNRVGATTSSRILVVDDSMADLVGDTPGERLDVYLEALDDGGFTQVSTWNTETQGTPTAAAMQGKIVVWFTGRMAWGWYDQETVDAAERAALASYLDNGGRLVMASGELATDMVYFYGDPEWFETYFQVTSVDIMTWGRGITGRAGTAFAGLEATIPDTYEDWETQYAPTGSDSVIAISSYAKPMARIGGYGELSGTSMAAPMVTGAAALLMSELPGTPADEIRARLENTVDVLPSLEGKVASGGRLNLRSAFDAYPGRPELLTPQPGSVLRAGDEQAVTWRTAAGASPDATFSSEYGIPYLHAEEGFETGDLAGFDTSGEEGWFATSDPAEVNSGSWAVRSGDIPEGTEEDGWIIGSTSVLETDVVVPDGGGVLNFSWWWDADDWDTMAVFEIDGKIVFWPWERFDWQQERVALSQGTHTLRWTFVRFFDRTVGRDGMGVDDISLTAWEFHEIGDAPAGATSIEWTVPSVDAYDARVRVRSHLDSVSSSWAYTDGLRITTDLLAPGPVSGLAAVPDNDGHVELNWTNPSDPDLDRVRIVRREGQTPEGPGDPDATVVYEGSEAQAIDGPLPHGTEAHYAAYAVDDSTNWSDPAFASAVVVDTTPPEAPSLFSASLYEGAPAISWMNPPLGSFAAIRLLRSTTGIPSGPDDPSATLVYEGAAAFAIDHALAEDGFEGTAHYAAWAIDASGNTSPGVYTELEVDLNGPEGVFVLNGDEPHTASALVTGESDVTDALEMRLHVNNEYDEDVEWSPFSEAVPVQLLEIDGPQSVIAEYRDAAGNVLTLWDDIYVNLDPPAAPTGVQAAAVGSKVKLSWDNPYDEPTDDMRATSVSALCDKEPPSDWFESDVEGYRIWKSTSAGGPWVEATEDLVYGNEWLVGALNAGEKSYFRVTAVDVVGHESEPSAIKSATPGALVVRTSGANRYATSAAVSGRYWKSSDTVVVATGAGFADALGASALAGEYDAPVLLTDPNALPPEVVAEIKRLGADRAIVIGGTAAVSATVEGAMGLLGLDVQRIAGKNRWETSAMVASEVVELQGGVSQSAVFLVNGYSFADALSAAPLAYRHRAPILLTEPGVLPDVTAECLLDIGAEEVVIVGGQSAVSEDVEQMVPATVTRVAGWNRYHTAASLAQWAVEDVGWASYGFIGLVSGHDFPDGLSGGAALGRAGGVMLLTESASLSIAAGDTLATHRDRIGQVRVTGGTRAVNAGVIDVVKRVLEE
jgi:subtilisin family serine protease/putative cell wall-binding protein